MIQADNWMNELTEKLKACFQNRLLFVGLQGSYQRQEAHTESDIDAVVILDTLSLNDLIAYRQLLQSLPESEKACGFISGKQELFHWAKSELFQFEQDTCAFYGNLHDLMPAIERMDIINGAKMSASNLYHACCHTAVHAPQQTDALKGIFKGAFFVLQIVYYLNNGLYIHSKRELLPRLSGDEEEILTVGMNWAAFAEKVAAKPDAYFDLILMWSSHVLNSLF